MPGIHPLRMRWEYHQPISSFFLLYSDTEIDIGIFYTQNRGTRSQKREDTVLLDTRYSLCPEHEMLFVFNTRGEHKNTLRTCLSLSPCLSLSHILTLLPIFSPCWPLRVQPVCHVAQGPANPGQKSQAADLNEGDGDCLNDMESSGESSKYLQIKHK